MFASSGWNHHAASWSILLQAWLKDAERISCAGGKLATPFDRDTFILQYGCNFPVAVSSGSLSFGLADGFYPLNVS
jgi:hypothetical protein